MAAGDERRKNAVVLSRVRLVQRRLDAELALKAAVVPAWCAVTALAAWRFVVQHHVLAAGLIIFAAAVVVWWALRRGRGVTVAQAAVIADRRADAGGLLLTRLELPVGEWELELNQRVRSVTAPPIDARRPIGLLMLAALLGVVSFIVPLPPRSTRPPSSAAATRVDELADKLDAVTREEPTDEALAKELERLREEVVDGTFDAADWEAADTLNAALDRQAAEAQAELSRSEAAAKSLEDAMKDAQGREGSTREREELEQALLAMSDGQAQSGEQAMQQALGENAQGEQGQQGQQGQGQQAQSGKGPSRSQMSELRQTLQQRQQQLSQQFSKGQGQQSQRQMSSRQGQQGHGQGQGAGEGEGEGKSEGQGESHASHRGKGGTGHGYSPPQDLIFGGEANIDPDRLKFEPLQPGHGGEADELFGLRAANPQKGQGSAHGSSTSAAASGTQARGNDDGALLPRNRVLIKRYFDSK